MFGFINSLINSLGYIWNTILAFAQFLINVVSSLIQFLTHIPEYVVVLTSSVDVLPTILIPFALASVSVYVVLFFIGK